MKFFLAHPNFNTTTIRDMREHVTQTYRRASRLVRFIPAPLAVPLRNGVGIIAGVSGFLPAIQDGTRPAFVTEAEYGCALCVITRDGAPVVRRSARKAYRSARLYYSLSRSR